MNEYVFLSDELHDYLRKIRNESKELIDKIIKENSVIQLGENVEVVPYFKEKTKIVRVTTIKLMAISLWGEPGERLSFYYEGVPLSKSGEPMKNRKPEWFGTFIKDGKKYHCPSYLKVKIIPAKMHEL